MRRKEIASLVSITITDLERQKTYRALSHRKMQPRASKLLLQEGYRWNRLKRTEEEKFKASAKTPKIDINIRTPPSRILNGCTPHSSSTAFSSALKYLLSRSPIHQSAVRSMVTCTRKKKHVLSSTSHFFFLKKKSKRMKEIRKNALSTH
jgi:hypothetical protein